MTSSAAPAPSTSMCGGCGPSSAPEHEQLIGTVRNVGYKFVRPVLSMSCPRERAAHEHAAEHDTETADSSDPDGLTRSGPPRNHCQLQRG